MCAVSFISDHYNKLTNPEPVWINPPFITWPQALPPALPWTPEALADLKDILKRLDALDKKLGLAACEDPKKAEWMRAVEDRLGKLERPRRRPRKQRA